MLRHSARRELTCFCKSMPTICTAQYVPNTYVSKYYESWVSLDLIIIGIHRWIFQVSHLILIINFENMIFIFHICFQACLFWFLPNWELSADARLEAAENWGSCSVSKSVCKQILKTFKNQKWKTLINHKIREHSVQLISNFLKKIHSLKCVCWCLSRDIRPNQLGHRLQ